MGEGRLEADDRRDADAARLGALLSGDVAALLIAVARTDLESLRFEDGDVAIEVGRVVASDFVPFDPGREGTVARPGVIARDPAGSVPAGPVPVKSLAVGFFHRSRIEGAPNLAEDGAAVDSGTIVAVVETLGMAGEVVTPVAGTLSFSVEDGHPVGYGDILALVHPA